MVLGVPILKHFRVIGRASGKVGQLGSDKLSYPTRLPESLFFFFSPQICIL